ncbi:MAG: DNA polymerase III subunit alpha [Candidatus Aminicenantes bacterium]|nr:DNA polymerase III subunit alpha [Candidatus Aminicenantes bacterium]
MTIKEHAEFVPLRVHSVYSKGRGGATLEELALWSAEKGVPAVLTDVENLYGWNGWNRLCRENGLSPIFGCEVKLQGGIFLFLIKRKEGYANLMEIFNRRNFGSLEGLATVFIPGPHGRGIPEDWEPFRKADVHIGVDFFNFSRALSLARSTGFPAVWASALKYIRHPERLILLHSINKKIPFPPERRKLWGKIKYFGPGQADAARKKFGSAAERLFKNTFALAEECRFSFEGIVPSLPENLFSGTFRGLVLEKLRKAKNLTWKERQRALTELDVIEKSGFAPYFMIVHDIVRFARSRGILHNLKGSGASSFVAYLLGISHVNPITFDLYFARFLNSGRNDPPDIDLDFDSRRRDEVLTYVLEKYGRGKTGAAFVCSLKNFRARSALYETARAFGVPPGEARSMSKKIPLFAEPNYLEKDHPAPGCLEIWRSAAGLKSVYCENSLHVGGIILTPAPADRYLPLEKSAKGYTMAHYDRDAVEDLKLIKLDLLSVRGLAAVSATKKMVNAESLPTGDKKTYSLLGQAKTMGCFQVESPAMMNLLRRMRPSNIYDLTQTLALIRPGPTQSGMKETLLRGREGKQTVRDGLLDKILPETGGLLLYEEQVMQVAERVAGMPADEGDILRRALKKKGGNSRLKECFFRQAAERGYAPLDVEKLWKVLEKFSVYSFNKAHSASYAHMAYQAVYLKAHFPVPYFASVLNTGGGYYGLAAYIEEAKRNGIAILGPDLNRSAYGFEVEGKSIRVGLSSIKGLGVKTMEKVIEERKGGEYVSLEDFLARVSLTKTVLLCLIKAGVFDSLEPRRTRQILCYFQGLKDMTNVADLAGSEKEKMLIASLGFAPRGDSLSLHQGQRPFLRVKDLKKYTGQEVEILVRVVDARQKEVSGGRKYFFLFEDESGLLEGVGEKKCLTFGEPPACYLRGKIRSDGGGKVKITDCSFIKP